jgi:hypothetical protein
VSAPACGARFGNSRRFDVLRESMELKVFTACRPPAGTDPAHPLPSAICNCSSGGPMLWILTIALAIVAFGLVKARRSRKTATGTAHQ